MRKLSLLRGPGLAGLTALLIAGSWTVSAGPDAGATTQGTIVGEGGDASTPIILKLIHDDSAGLAPDFASYTNVDLDVGITDFVGSAPGTFGNDFAVTERPLTTAEVATAKANGRSFAYVPIAAVPDALLTLVPDAAWNNPSTILPAQFCQHIQLDLAQLDGIYGAPAFSGWGDSNLNCTTNPPTAAGAQPFGLWGNADPTIENEALMALLDSTATSKGEFAAGLAAAVAGKQASTSDPTPTESWPFAKSVPGGDETTFGKILNLSRTNQLSTDAPLIAMGAIMPVANDWTGAPLGVTWNLPTAAVQNAGGDYVVPSGAAAAAAEANITLASTSDPTTNNVVTSFNAISPDPNGCDTTGKPNTGSSPPQVECPYNNWLMLESYLVVPTNGLPADKALALAQFIRFAVGGTGQADIAALGAAGATPAEVSADLAVAQQLDAEAATAGSSSTSTTTTTSATAAAAPSSSTPGASNANAPASTGSTGAGSGGTLATTGSNPSVLGGVGLVFLVCGELARRLLRRRRAKL